MPDTPNNIDAFNSVVAHTLLTLYEHFPNPLDLKARTLGYQAAGDVSEEDSFEVISETAKNTISFLIREGIIHYNPERRTMGGAEFPQAVLTMIGLTVLGKIPNSVIESASSQPFIDQLQGAIKAGASDTLKNTVQLLLTNFVTSGANALGG